MARRIEDILSSQWHQQWYNKDRIPNAVGDWEGKLGKLVVTRLQALNHAKRQPVTL